MNVACLLRCSSPHSTSSVSTKMLAALAYARNPPGIWFFNPSKWVEQHMFKSASVWDIPLVKPRFSCMVDLKLAGRGYDLGMALRQTLTHFQGATIQTMPGCY